MKMRTKRRMLDAAVPNIVQREERMKSIKTPVEGGSHMQYMYVYGAKNEFHAL